MTEPRKQPTSDELLAALAELARLFWGLGQRAGWQPQQISTAMKDREEPALVVADWDDVKHLAHIIQAHTLAAAISAHDHLCALVRLLEKPSRLYAAHSTARGLLEVSARCWYVIDQSVPAVERARRVLNDTMYSLHEVAVLREAAGVDAVQARMELAQVASAARGMGLHVVESGTRKAPTVGERRPSSTILSTLLLDRPDGLAFRTTSGVAHANITALLRVAGPETQIWEALRDPQGTNSLADETLHVEFLEVPVAFCKMAVRVAGYFNWEGTEWMDEFHKTFQVWLR